MGRFDRANLILGLAFVAIALVIALLWAPMDSATGLIEKVRRQVTIGDALAPTLAATFLLVGGAMVALFETPSNAMRLTPGNLRFVAMLLAILILSFGIMRWLGPVTGEALAADGYRPMRDTAPWKYAGFLAGGVTLIAGLIALVEGRVTLRAVLIGLGASVVLIVVYDLPFDDLLLPPNGDV